MLYHSTNRLTGKGCAGISLCMEGLRNSVTAEDKLYSGFFPTLVEKTLFFRGTFTNVSAFIANNSLACSSSSSPFRGILTVVGTYHRSLCKGSRFPRQLSSRAEIPPSPTAAGQVSLQAYTGDQDRHAKSSFVPLIIWPISLHGCVQWCVHK